MVLGGKGEGSDADCVCVGGSYRVEPYDSDYEFVGVLVYGAGGVVGGGEGDFER